LGTPAAGGFFSRSDDCRQNIATKAGQRAGRAETIKDSVRTAVRTAAKNENKKALKNQGFSVHWWRREGLSGFVFLMLLIVV
jgi:hypothetical protein